jgi:serine/threonine protein kinase
MNKMLAYKPEERLSYAEILDHAWLQGETASGEEMQ